MSSKCAERLVEVADRALGAIAVLAQDEAPTIAIGPDLAGGWAGMAVALAAGRRIGLGSCTEHALEAALDKTVETAPALGFSTSLYSGVVGLSWALRRCEELCPSSAPGEADAVDPVDELVGRVLELDPWPGGFDLTRGLAGLAVHLADRPPTSVGAIRAERLVAHLRAAADSTDGRSWWTTTPSSLGGVRPTLAADGEVDLGVAHGMGGVIAALGALSGSLGTLRRQQARVLAGEAVSMMRGCALGTDDARFPAMVRPDSARSGARPAERGSRLAWCYGDPGLAWALAQAASDLDDQQLLVEALTTAIAAARRPDSEAGVFDAGLCHGAAGVALCLQHAAMVTGSDEVAAAAAKWAEAATTARLSGDGDGALGGFRAWRSNPDDPDTHRWLPQPGLLDGTAGIALGLLAAAGHDPAGWDGFLMPRARLA